MVKTQQWNYAWGSSEFALNFDFKCVAGLKLFTTMKRNLIKTGRQINSSPMPWPKIVAKFHTKRADGLRIGPLFKHSRHLETWNHFLAFEIRPSGEQQHDFSGGPETKVLMSDRIRNMENDHNKMAHFWQPKSASPVPLRRFGRYVQRERQQRFYERHKTHARFKRLQRHEEIEIGSCLTNSRWFPKCAFFWHGTFENNLAVWYFGRHIRKLDASNFCWADTVSVRSPNWTSIPAKLFTEFGPCRSCCLCCRLGCATKHYGRSVTTAARRHCWNACWQRLQSGHVAFVRN